MEPPGKDGTPRSTKTGPLESPESARLGDREDRPRETKTSSVATAWSATEDDRREPASRAMRDVLGAPPTAEQGGGGGGVHLYKVARQAKEFLHSRSRGRNLARHCVDRHPEIARRA